jgi:hypothetical protein
MVSGSFRVMAEPWLLITVSTSGPSSTLRVHALRKLRSLAALALAQSVYVVPERPATVRAVNRLRARPGGGAREVEESDADLARFQKWLAAVRKRDYFGADGRDQAEAAVDACERALSEFEAEAYARRRAPPRTPGRCPLPQAHQPNR